MQSPQPLLPLPKPTPLGPFKPLRGRWFRRSNRHPNARLLSPGPLFDPRLPAHLRDVHRLRARQRPLRALRPAPDALIRPRYPRHNSHPNRQPVDQNPLPLLPRQPHRRTHPALRRRSHPRPPNLERRPRRRRSLRRLRRTTSLLLSRL